MSNDKKSEVLIRYTELSDEKYLKEWLIEPSTLRWFPMADEVEVEDSASRWISFCRYRCSLTATIDDVPCGLATLYLQPYRFLAHQCEMGIIVSRDFRGNRIGELLMERLMDLAKNSFRIEILHLQVYGENPALRLYKKFGFREFGRQTRWLKNEEGVYSTRVFMERIL